MLLFVCSDTTGFSFSWFWVFLLHYYPYLKTVSMLTLIQSNLDITIGRSLLNMGTVNNFYFAVENFILRLDQLLFYPTCRNLYPYFHLFFCFPCCKLIFYSILCSIAKIWLYGENFYILTSCHLLDVGNQNFNVQQSN